MKSEKSEEGVVSIVDNHPLARGILQIGGYATYYNTGSLSAKLNFIWKWAIAVLDAVECREKRRIKNLWLGAGFPNWSDMNLIEKINVSHKLKNFKTGKLNESYVNILDLIYEIAQGVRRCSKDESSFENDLSRKVMEFIASDNFCKGDLLNDVLPIFFALQLRCHDLQVIYDRPKGAPIDWRSVADRAHKGGVAKNFGEDVLKQRVLNFFKSDAFKKSNSGIEKIVSDNNLALIEILDKYKSDIRSGLLLGDKVVRYGANLEFEGLLASIKRWSKDVDFKSHLKI